MTANQINWYNAQEQKRHNLATEGIQTGTLVESSRHNVASENLTHESNLIQQWLNEQTAKHYERMDHETNRHNVVYEMETNRHNVNLENISAGEAALSHKTKQRELDIKEKELPIEERKADASYLNSWVNFISFVPETTRSRTQSDLNKANIGLTNEKKITEQTERLRKESEIGVNFVKTIKDIVGIGTDLTKVINIFE